MTDTLDRVQRSIDLVEHHLFDDLPLAVLARRGGCSPWHFHRLFVALTGETPGSYVWKRRLADLRIVRRSGFHAIGIARRFTLGSTGIPELWGRFAPRIHEIADRRALHTLGLCLVTGPTGVDAAGFTYLAGVERDHPGTVPNGMTEVTVPENTYVVVTHTGHVARLPDTVRHVWAWWLPASGHRHVPAPDFELYDPTRWNPGTGEGEIDLYIPLVDE